MQGDSLEVKHTIKLYVVNIIQQASMLAVPSMLILPVFTNIDMIKLYDST